MSKQSISQIENVIYSYSISNYLINQFRCYLLRDNTYLNPINQYSIRFFECPNYPWLRPNQYKMLESHSMPCVFIRYSLVNKGILISVMSVYKYL